MGTENEPGASPGNDGGGTTPPPPAPGTPAPDTAPKLEVKTEGDRQVLFVDGKKVVYEHELIAAKKSLEQQMETAQTVHNDAIDRAKVESSDALSKVAVANAEVTRLTKEIEDARTSGGTSSPEDVSKLKQDLEAATSRADTADASVLDTRKKLILTTYPGQVTEEQLKEKTPAQLDAFEEALKALATSRGGPGPYAVGGGTGSTEPMSEMDRAKGVLERTPPIGRAAPSVAP